MESKTLKPLLNEFYAQILANNSTLAAMFNDGLDKSAIDANIQNLPIKLPPEAYELFGWKNGLNDEKTSELTIGQSQIIPLGIFSPLNTCIKAYNFYAINNAYWKKEMFPLFESGGGDFYLLDCDSTSDTYRMIWLSMPSLIEFNGLVTKYDSLESLLMTTIECFNSKVYYYGHSNEEEIQELNLEVDDELEHVIGKKHNLKSEYWKIFK